MNAAGRMGEAHDVVELLLTRDEGRIKRITDTLSAQNALRKKVQDEVFSLCVDMVEGRKGRKKLADEPFYVINAGDSHEGITGIVAGKLRERYSRPVIILTDSGEAGDGPRLKGTGRSVPGVDLYALLRKRADMFEKFGGHAMACGFLMRAEREDGLRAGLVADMNELLAADPDALKQDRTPDIALDPKEIGPRLIKELDRMAPFGNGNPQPLIELRGLKISRLSFMGDERQHAKFTSEGLDVVMFGSAAGHAGELREGREVAALGYPSIDRWNGRERIQFVAEAIRAERKAE
jgi:single-stranded-DNA-specific exonuclease